MPKTDYQRFRVIKGLGAGRFGRTLLVEDQERNSRRVVIKVPQDKETEEALIRELINAAQLRASLENMSHPNIVRFFDFARHEDYYVMILEYVEGRDLRKIVGPSRLKRKPLEIRYALTLFEHVCRGLYAAHQKANLLHRDIKPENILVRDEDGIAKITDFGISTILQNSTSVYAAGVVAGTFPYMAPEALSGKATFQSDLWSLAVTLYEMVTGQLPFLSDNFFDLKHKIDRVDPDRPSSINPNVDARLESLIMQGLEKDLDKRFRTAQEMLDVLEPELDNQISEARQTFSEGREDEAEKRILKLLEWNPDHPKLFMVLGEFFNRRQQFAEAQSIIEKGIRRCPGHAALHFYLAPALWGQGEGKRSLAVASMARAIELGLSQAQERQARVLLSSWKNAGGRT